MGYLNVTRRDELGREVRTAEVDPDRAPLVRWAFEAYATGNYSTISLPKHTWTTASHSPETAKRST